MKLTAVILLIAGFAAAQNTPVFPSRAVTNGDLFVATNNYATTLLTGITSATATSATVASATGLTIPAMVTIDTEIFAVCRVTGNTLTFGKSSCPNADGRGYDGTVAVNHLAGRPVEARVVAGLHNQAAAEVIALENATPVMVSDLGPYTTLSAANAKAVSAGRALAISKSWPGVPTQTLGSVTFVKGGMIQPASGQVVTITGSVQCAPDQQCFDISLAGPGSIKFTGRLSSPVYASWFGAVCNGVLDPAAGNFHDDYPALMSAHSSLPLNQLVGGMTPSGTPLPAGTVIIPNTATLASGANGGCVIGPADPGLYWSPYVRLQSASSMFNAIIEAAQGFAPQVGSNYTITGINACGGGVTCTVSVASTAGLASGDTVEIHGIGGFHVAGPWQLNAWANNHNQGFNLNGGMWQIANVTGTSFDLAGSGAFGSLVAWVSGGTAVKGSEKFLLTLINTHDGASPYPVDNYNVNIGDISLYAQAPNNQFASGLFCNCSVSTWIHHDLISVPYRAFVAAIGIDNVTMDDLLISGPPTRTNGPDGQAVSIITNDPQETFATHVRNLKVHSGAAYNNWTPAVSIGGGATTFHLDVADFETVAWPIAINIGGQVGQNISLEHITAKTDTFTGGTCPTPLLNTVVAVLNSPTSNQVATGINVSGDFQCFTSSITQGSAPADLTQIPGMPVPQGAGDSGWLPLTYDDNNWVTHSFLAAPWVNTLAYAPGFVVTCAIAVCTTQTGSSLMYVARAGVTTGSRPDISPASWAATTGAPTVPSYTGFNTFTNGVYQPSVWSSPNSFNWLVAGNDQGFRCFKDIFGVGAPTSTNFERLLMTTSDCTAAGTPADQNRFIEMRSPTVPFPNNGANVGYGLALDGDGKVGTGIGGNLLLKGTELNLGIPFSQLPAPVAGTRVWVTDGAVGSNPCTGGGNGTWAETISTGPGTFKWVCR